MEVTTEHKFIDTYLIKRESKYLIIGTIHPHRTDDFEVNFFYGNKNTLWSILSEAFPSRDFSSEKKIIETLNNSLTSVTDLIRKCDRENENVTKDKDLYNLCMNTNAIREGIEKSSITTIFFTSGFGKNNAAKLFVEIFKIRYKDTWSDTKKSFIIPKDVFGREINAIILLSPSGDALRGIAGSPSYKKKRHLYANEKTPVKQFRIDFYKEKFKDVFNTN